MTTNALIVPALASNLSAAAALLRMGKLVAFPTETVYGLGADATNDHAVASIFVAKGRPNFNPLIIHVATPQQLDNLIIWNDTARLLASQYWPGPLTLVLPRAKNCPVSQLASAGLPSLAVRIPHHKIAQDLLRLADRPIAAPSANSSGKLSPTTPQHVAASLGTKVDMILAGGKTNVGVESTVISLLDPMPILLRHGAITREQIEQLLDYSISVATSDNAAPQAPGMLLSHYAPNIPVRLDAVDVKDNEALLAFGYDGGIVGGATRLNLSESGDLTEAAANLFAMLHQLDMPEHQAIAVMPIPRQGLGAAINDRLHRAAQR